MQNKLRVGVLFGGRSGEHEVSLVSATSVMSALDKEKYEIIPVGIAKDGKWFAGDGVMEALKKGLVGGRQVTISLDPNKRGLVKIPPNPPFSKGGEGELRNDIQLDVIFPVLHGTFGEDGTVQGLFEMAGIPYVGAGVIGSAVGMDKILQKEIARESGINTPAFMWFLSSEFKHGSKDIIARATKEIGFPCFVKPANSGSSVGISKAHNSKELAVSIEDAVRYDRRVLVEKGVDSAREIEVSILGNEEPKASVLGEVVPSNEFYDYDAKYVDGKSKTIVPADMPATVSDEIKKIALKMFRELDLCGMARVDFLVTKDEVFFSEVNTIPGFTSISMYPKLWEASGVPYPKLLDELIALALGRFSEKSELLTSYQPKKKWY